MSEPGQLPLASYGTFKILYPIILAGHIDLLFQTLRVSLLIVHTLRLVLVALIGAVMLLRSSSIHLEKTFQLRQC